MKKEFENYGGYIALSITALLTASVIWEKGLEAETARDLRSIGIGPVLVDNVQLELGGIVRPAIVEVLKRKFSHFELIENTGFGVETEGLSFRMIRDKYRKQPAQADLLMIITLRQKEVPAAKGRQQSKSVESRLVLSIIRTQDFRELTASVIVVQGQMESTIIREKMDTLVEGALFSLPFKAWVSEALRGGRVYINAGSLLGLTVGTPIRFVNLKPAVEHTLLPKVLKQEVDIIAEGVVLSVKDRQAFANISSRKAEGVRIDVGQLVTW